MFSDRMVFVRAVHEARWMDDMELAVYDSWCARAPLLSMPVHNCTSRGCFERWRPYSEHDLTQLLSDLLLGVVTDHERWPKMDLLSHLLVGTAVCRTAGRTARRTALHGVHPALQTAPPALSAPSGCAARRARARRHACAQV